MLTEREQGATGRGNQTQAAPRASGRAPRERRVRLQSHPAFGSLTFASVVTTVAIRAHLASSFLPGRATRARYKKVSLTAAVRRRTW